MSLLIGHVESSYTDDPTVEPEASWKGYVYAAAMLTVLVSSTLLNQYQAHLMYVIGMNIKTTVTASVYKKALKLSGSAKKETTVGEIVNLMSVDVQRFMDLVPYLNMLL
jgi:ATP-binding cassette subfamily C (CFTR/MRP) protein 1